MSIYSNLTTLFKLAEKLGEYKEFQYLDEDDIDNIKYLADIFIKTCNNILSITCKTEDEKSMRKIFFKTNYDLLIWLTKNYCQMIDRNYLENLLINLEKEKFYKIDIPDNINNIKDVEENFKFNDILGKEQSINNESELKMSKNTFNQINFIENNYQDNNKNDININQSDFSVHNVSTNITEPIKFNQDLSNKNIKKEHNEEKEDDNEEEEEEEEEDDDEDFNNKEFVQKKEEIIENNKINENFKNEEINQKEYNNDENELFGINNNNLEINENIEEEPEEENEGEENLINEKDIKEKENLLNEITRKTIIEYFQIFNSQKDQNQNFNNIYMSAKDLIDYYDKFDAKIKEKLITFICAIYPFCSEKQKENLSEININDEKIKVFLSQTLLYFKGNKNLYDLLISMPSKKSKRMNQEIIRKNLLINSESDLFALYQIYDIYKSIYLKKEEIEKIFFEKFSLKNIFGFIPFKIIFILSHHILYPCISENILSIFERFLFIKKFYSKAFLYKIEEPYIISQINQFKEEFKELTLDEIIKKLFDEEEINIYNKTIKYVKHFYKTNNTIEYDLLYYSNIIINNKVWEKNIINYNFLVNIFEMIYIKSNLLYNNKLQRNLDKLERNIQAITRNLNSYNNKNHKKQDNSCYEFSNKFENIFNKIKSNIKKSFPIEIRNKVELYPLAFFIPFICHTKFEKDLLIILDIYKLKNFEKKDVIDDLDKFLTQEYKAKKKFNEKNLKYYFEYENINIKIIILGASLYIKSIILREYSFLDQRFPILILTLNYFLKEIGLFEYNNQKYVNIIQNLLIAFLQDIINPPILPKILSKDILNVKNIPSGYEFNEGSYHSFIYKGMHLPKNIFDKEKIRNIYNEQINKNKNILSCAEIFLKFLEFIIYFYKFDSIYINLSLNYEGFDSINNISNIINIYDEENIFFKNNPNDFNFIEKFYKYYKTNKSDNIILIREPANLSYRIGPLYFQNFREFYKKIKAGYEILINTGSFNDLKKIKDINKQE